MTYSDKVKQSKNVLDSIYSLKPEQELNVTYGTDYKGEPKEFRIRCYKNYNNEGFHYSIWEENGFGGMNILKIGRTTMKGYTYDMMSQKTTYTFPLYQLSIVK